MAVVLSSGDLGWAGFVVDVAQFLRKQGIAVLGFNTKAYLESFTHGGSTLTAAQVPGDYAVLAREARRLLEISSPPVLVGISEGAGLSVIAAASKAERRQFQGVVCLGLPDSVELGWRAWRDWTIWITKGTPNEPQADRHGGSLVFYEVQPESLPLYVDLGLTFLKLGEEARVPLQTFSLEGALTERTASHLSKAGKRRLPL